MSSVLNVKAVVAAFPSRGLLRDCTTSPINRLHSSINRSLEAAKLEDSVEEAGHNTSSGTLNFRINLKEQRMTQAPLNKSMEESIIKTPLIGSKIQKLTKTKKPKMTTSTPKPRKVTKKTARSTGA